MPSAEEAGPTTGEGPSRSDAGPDTAGAQDGQAEPPVGLDDPTPDPEPEAVLTAERIEGAGTEQPLIAHGEGDDVPPAPEPTFGTVPDPEAAASAPVNVATPIDPEPETALPIPQRPDHDERSPAT